MVECVDRYYGEFKPYLRKTLPVKKWTRITENNYARQKQAILNSTPEEIFDWVLSSATESYLAPAYEILIMGKRIFHNENDRSVIKLVFPLSLLKEPDGKGRYENWLLWLRNTFEVESGCAELSFVLPYAFEQMFPYEYALAQRFSGVMVDSLGTLRGSGRRPQRCLQVHHSGHAVAGKARRGRRRRAASGENTGNRPALL